MQDNMLSCSEARLRMTTYLEGEPCPELAAHLARCEACLEACMEAALRRPADVRVPDHFRAQVLARIPSAVAVETEENYWALLAAASFLAALGAALWWSGSLPGITVVTETLGRPAMLAAAGGIETALSLVWLWRVATAQQ